MSLNSELWKVHKPTKQEIERDGDWNKHSDGLPPCGGLVHWGCRHWRPIAWPWFGNLSDQNCDFGVCANPKSCRAGMVTHWSWGCFDFEC